MRAILADISTSRYLYTAAAQKAPGGRGRRAGWGPRGILQLVYDEPAPALPHAPGWVRLRPELTAICGSDIGLAHAKLSFVLSAFYPETRVIPGHEIVAVVDEIGPGVTRVKEGDRVTVDVVISCAQRGFDPVCRNCAAGMPNLCERFDLPGVIGCAGVTLGYVRGLGGGWAEQALAHESMLFPVGAMPSARAVLTEPTALTLHSVLQWPGQGERAVVIGPGAIGLLSVAALKRLHPDLHVSVVCPGEFWATWAARVGADRTLPVGPSALEQVAEQDGGRLLRATMTRLPLLERGVELVVDCVGSPETIDLGLHMLRPRGMLILIGAAGRQTTDWSLLWRRELTVQGTTDPGPEPTLGGRRTHELALEWLADPTYPVDGFLTQVFDLADWRQALDTASRGPAAGAIRVGLRPNPDLPLVDA